LVSNSANTPSIEKRFACGDAGVDRLLGRLQRDAAGLELVHDVLEVPQRSSQAINAGDDKGVTGAQELKRCLEFGVVVATRIARFLGADHLAARRFECGVLDRKVLIEGRDPGVTVNLHTRAKCLVSY
jgi:hypothetical protein